MPVPTCQEFLLPVLAFVQNSATHTARNLRDGLANQLGLTEDELRETIPSGKKTVLHSRVHWACYHLKRNGLARRWWVDNVFIADRAREVTKTSPASLTNTTLRTRRASVHHLGLASTFRKVDSVFDTQIGGDSAGVREQL